MYAGSDKDMGFALAASLLADAIAGRPLPPLPLQRRSIVRSVREVHSTSLATSG